MMVFDKVLHAHSGEVDHGNPITGAALPTRLDRGNIGGCGDSPLVAVQRTAHVHEGDLVVARIGQDVTLKRFHRKSKDAVELQPESTNPEHRRIPIDAHTEDAEIVGVVVGAIVGTRQHTRRHQEVGLGWEPDMGM